MGIGSEIPFTPARLSVPGSWSDVKGWIVVVFFGAQGLFQMPKVGRRRCAGRRRPWRLTFKASVRIKAGPGGRTD